MYNKEPLQLQMTLEGDILIVKKIGSRLLLLAKEMVTRTEASIILLIAAFPSMLPDTTESSDCCWRKYDQTGGNGDRRNKDAIDEAVFSPSSYLIYFFVHTSQYLIITAQIRIFYPQVPVNFLV